MMSDFAAGPEQGAHKKIGVKSGDPNRHSQPRLPGSVVGEPSMLEAALRSKITKVSVPQVTLAREPRAESGFVS
jgi:hypothetical protein